jgi:hypothetical protein
MTATASRSLGTARRPARVLPMAIALALLWAHPAPVLAQQQSETVQSLISKGYVVVSSFFNQAGPGIFLQKADSLYFCVATETPNSTDLRTQYCKPVH